MRLELDARARSLLRRLPRANVYSLLEIVLLGLLAVQCARLVWVIVTPVDPLGDWRPTQPGIAGASGDVLRGFDPFFRLNAPQNGPAQVTSLQLTLFGTRINEATGLGSAIIATPDKTQDSYSVGDEIMPGVKLKAVAYDHVTLDRGGAVEDLYLDQSDAVTPVSPPPSDATAPTPPRTGPAGKGPAQNGVTLGDLQSGIGIIPRVDGGRITGLVLRPKGDGQIFRKAGLKPGDIATEVNGKPVTGPGDIQTLASSLQNGGIISLMVERGAKTVPIGITVTGP